MTDRPTSRQPLLCARGFRPRHASNPVVPCYLTKAELHQVFNLHFPSSALIITPPSSRHEKCHTRFLILRTTITQVRSSSEVVERWV